MAKAASYPTASTALGPLGPTLFPFHHVPLRAYCSCREATITHDARTQVFTWLQRLPKQRRSRKASVNGTSMAGMKQPTKRRLRFWILLQQHLPNQKHSCKASVHGTGTCRPQSARWAFGCCVEGSTLSPPVGVSAALALKPIAVLPFVCTMGFGATAAPPSC